MCASTALSRPYRTGATVYVTGRSRNADDSPYGGMVAETAALVAEPLPAPRLAPVTTATGGPFWTEPPAVADLLTVGLRSHYIAAFYAAPLMFAG